MKNKYILAFLGFCVVGAAHAQELNAVDFASQVEECDEDCLVQQSLSEQGEVLDLSEFGGAGSAIGLTATEIGGFSAAAAVISGAALSGGSSDTDTAGIPAENNGVGISGNNGLLGNFIRANAEEEEMALAALLMESSATTARSTDGRIVAGCDGSILEYVDGTERGRSTYCLSFSSVTENFTEAQLIALGVTDLTDTGGRRGRPDGVIDIWDLYAFSIITGRKDFE